MAASLLLSVGVKSQTTDVTETYIPNAGFEACEVVTNNAQGAADVHTDYATALGTDYDAVGWQLVSQAKSANGGAIAYNADLHVQYSKWNVAGDQGPAAGPTGTTGNKGLCFSGNASVVYRQAEAITLPAGTYKLTVNVWARNGETSNPKPTQQVVNDKTGFLPENGTDDDLMPAVRKSLQFASNAWDTEVLEFELTEATTGRFQLSYGSSYFVVIDDLKLEHNGGIVTTALAKVVTKAKALNAKLNSNDLATAIGVAEAFMVNPTTQEDVPVQVETLYSAMGAALAASEGVIDITASYVENPSFETGVIAPWAWGKASGLIDEPASQESVIDGTKIAYFGTSGTNTITQTIANLPAGFYIVEARLNGGKAKIAFGSSSTEYTGGVEDLYLRVSSPATEFAGGETTISSTSSVAYHVDDFHLYYAHDAASLSEAMLQHQKTDAQMLLDNPKFDIVTGKERTELADAITTGSAITTKENAFYKVLADYTEFKKAKTASASYTKEAYPYATEGYFQEIQTMCATVATSAAHASVLADQLNEACFNLYVSNAYCKGVECTDYTDHILGANATEEATGWGAVNMAVRNDKNAWKNPETGETDKVVYGVTTDYYRASKDVASIMKQTLKGLPAGKYVLSMTAMGSSGLEVYVFFNSEQIGTMKMTGISGGGVYGAGWNDYVIEFTKANANDMPLQLQCKPENNYKEWYIDNFRLYLLPEGGDGIADNMVNRKSSNGQYFDLSGRRVAQPTKGLYIVDGKKVVKK